MPRHDGDILHCIFITLPGDLSVWSSRSFYSHWRHCLPLINYSLLSSRVYSTYTSRSVRVMKPATCCGNSAIPATPINTACCWITHCNRRTDGRYEWWIAMTSRSPRTVTASCSQHRCLVHSTCTELNWPGRVDPVTTSALIGHACSVVLTG